MYWDKMTWSLNTRMKKTLNKFIQKEDGLHISVVRAQRIYNNSKWPNPITVKLEYVVPALYPPVVETVKADVAESKVTLKAKLIKKGDVGSVKVGFEYRPYGGFVENLYSTNWDKSKLVEISEEKEFSIEIGRAHV